MCSQRRIQPTLENFMEAGLSFVIEGCEAAQALLPLPCNSLAGVRPAGPAFAYIRLRKLRRPNLETFVHY